jgi:PqqD family protein of HPr-rel-A system
VNDRSPEQRRWRPAPDLQWACYDDSDDWVVYHPGSCETHLISAAAHRLWLLVSDGAPRSVDRIAAELATALDRPLDEEMAVSTAATLEFMDRVGLLYPVPA